jgi:Ca-activated chloride channel homolog
MIVSSHAMLAAPVWLWLLLPATAIAIWDLVRRRRQGHGLPIAATAVRWSILAALIVSLADPRWPEHGETGHLVIIVDRSASIPDATLDEAMARARAMHTEMGDDVDVGLVMFDGDPEVAVFPGTPWTTPDPLREEPVEATDIDAALRMAMGLIPADDPGAIVLLSDGRPTTALHEREAVMAQADLRGITIHAMALEPSREQLALTAVELAQPSARPGSTARGRVEIDGALEETSAVLVVRAAGTEVVRQRVNVPAQTRIDVPFSHDLDVDAAPGPMDVTVQLLVDDDGPPADTASTTLVVDEPPRVRIFAGEAHDGRALGRALRAERMDVEVVEMDDLSSEHEDLSDVDLVVLANAPAISLGGGKALESPFAESLVRFVDAGGGLLVLGGPQAYDMGGYAASPLARMLPVKLDPNDFEVQAAATMIVILDRSGSMSALVGYTKSKMQLADEGAVASVRLLRPFDNIGVMSVTEVVRWDVPVQRVRDIESIERRVLRIRADGGGIFVYTALEEAYAALRKVDTPLKHIIVFSDAADSEEKVKGIPFGTGSGPTSEGLARKMRGDKITTSVIGIGAEHDIDTPFLKDLARAGGGRFYLTEDATRLRSLFVEETERIVDSSLHQIVFRPVVEQPHPIIDGIDYARGPTLGGFQELTARPTAEVVLVGPKGHPVLTTWRYGLGHVVAWSSDAGSRWASRWLRWDGYTRQWTQAARFALRTKAGDETAVEVDFAGGAAQLRVARRDDHGLSLHESGLHAHVRDAETTRELALVSDEPGMWQARLSVEPGRSHTVEVVDDEGEVLATHTFAAPPSVERRHRTADVGYLRTLTERTGGSFEPQETITPPAVAAVTTGVHRLWPLLLVLALLLMPLDAALRRPLRVV